MLSRLQGKQNLWWLTDGHCTKCVSSSRSWHNVHLSVAFCAAAAAFDADAPPVAAAFAAFMPPLAGPLLLLPPGPPPLLLPPTFASPPLAPGGSGPLLPPALPPLPLLTLTAPLLLALPPPTLLPLPGPTCGVFAGLDCTSELVTVVLETWREPEERRPDDEPAVMKELKLKNHF